MHSFLLHTITVKGVLIVDSTYNKVEAMVKRAQVVFMHKILNIDPFDTNRFTNYAMYYVEFDVEFDPLRPRQIFSSTYVSAHIISKKKKKNNHESLLYSCPNNIYFVWLIKKIF